MGYLLHRLIGKIDGGTGYEGARIRHTVRSRLEKVMPLLFWKVLFFLPLPKSGDEVVGEKRERKSHIILS